MSEELQSTAAHPLDEIAYEKVSLKDFGKGMGKLMRYIARYWPMLVSAVILAIAASALSVVVPEFVNRLTNVIIDAVTLQGVGYYLFGVVGPVRVDVNAVAGYGFLLVAFYSLTAILNYLRDLIMVRANNKSAMDLRGKISRKINVVPLKYYDKNTIGDVLSRTTNDIDRISDALTWSLTPLVGQIVLIAGVLIIMFYHSWVLSLAALATIPVAMFLVGATVALSQRYFKRQADYLGELNGIIEENFSGQSVVKAFNGEARAAEQFAAVNNRHYKASLAVQVFQGAMFPAMNYVAMLGFIAVCIVGGILHLRPMEDPLHVSIGMIVAFTLYIGLFQQAIGTIGESFGGLQAAAAASIRVFAFLEEPEQEDESAKGQPLDPDAFKGRIEFKNVRFGYLPEKTIIHNFSAVVQPGQKVAIVGPTGAGKTTMVNLLMRFYEIESGQILLDGIDIRDMKREHVRALFGMVLQDTWLFEGSIEENIKYALSDATHAQVVAVCKAVGIDHFIRGLPGGYGMVLDDDVNIAGGQRQLLTIARAMLQDSPCLILDEATSNVDTRTERLIQQAMDTLTEGRTSFVIAHRLSTIKNADLILAMKDGDIVEMGTHEQLLEAGGFYAGLYNSQFGGLNA